MIDKCSISNGPPARLCACLPTCPSVNSSVLSQSLSPRPIPRAQCLPVNADNR